MDDLHRADEATIKRMLVCETVPPEVVEECGKCRWMLSRSGWHNPLGAAVLMSILRRMGFESPPLAKPIVDLVEWEVVAPDTRVAVDLGEQLGVREGVFIGKRSAGGYDVLVEGLKPAMRICSVKQLSLDLSKITALENGDSTIAEDDLDEDWDDVLSGTPVVVNFNNKELSGQFVQVIPDSEKLTVAIAARADKPGYEKEFKRERVALVG